MGFLWGEERKRHLQEMQNEQKVFELTYEIMGTRMREPLSYQFIRGMISTFHKLHSEGGVGYLLCCPLMASIPASV